MYQIERNNRCKFHVCMIILVDKCNFIIRSHCFQKSFKSIFFYNYFTHFLNINTCIFLDTYPKKLY